MTVIAEVHASDGSINPHGIEKSKTERKLVTLSEIRPIPKIPAKRKSQRNEQSEIIISFPYKKRLIEKDAGKKENELETNKE